MRVPLFVGGRTIEWDEKEVPVPLGGVILVRVKANALCGSERGQYVGGSKVTPGHETAGEISAVGPGTSLAVGTRGVVYLMDFCGECRSCRAGATNQCLVKRADTGFNRDGGYGPFLVTHESAFFPMPDELPFDEATLLLDIIGTGGHAIRRAQRVHDDVRSVLVAGAGPIGLGVVAVVRTMLGDGVNVDIFDPIAFRLELAASLGANTLPFSEPLPVRAYDVAIDTTGKAEARRRSLDALTQRGALICVGHGAGIDLNVSRDLIGPERAVLGSEYFPFGDLPGSLELLMRNRDYFSRIITHRIESERIGEAFDTFFAGDTGKVVIVRD